MKYGGLIIAGLVLWWLLKNNKTAEASGQTYATGYNPHLWDSQTSDTYNGWQGGSY